MDSFGTASLAQFTLYRAMICHDQQSQHDELAMFMIHIMIAGEFHPVTLFSGTHQSYENKKETFVLM